MILKKRQLINLCLIVGIGMAGCKSLDSSQAVYFEDRDMDFDAYHEQLLEENVFSYREAAAGGTKGKTGGGCGCN